MPLCLKRECTLQRTLLLNNTSHHVVHPKDQSWVFIGRTDAKAETPILWLPHAKSWLIGKDPEVGRDWGQEEKGTTEDEMAGWHHRLDGMGLGELVMDREALRALIHGVAESDRTERMKWTELKPSVSHKLFAGCCYCLVSQLCLTLCNPVDCSPRDSSWGFSRHNIGVGCHALLQATFPMSLNTWPTGGGSYCDVDDSLLTGLVIAEGEGGCGNF